MVEIELALQDNDMDAAKAGLLNLWQQAREHFPLVIALLLRHPSFYNMHGSAMLTDLWREHRDAELMLAWIEVLARDRSPEEAQRCCDEMAFEPVSLRQSLRLHAVLGDDTVAHTRFARQWRKTARNYACEQCGVEVVELRWQCPQCHSWGTLHPKSEEKI